MARIEDKHGTPIKQGDKIHFVYGGDHHEATAESLTPAGPDAALDYVAARIWVAVPAASVTVDPQRVPGAKLRPAVAVEKTPEGHPSHQEMDTPTVEDSVKEARRDEAAKRRERDQRRREREKQAAAAKDALDQPTPTHATVVGAGPTNTPTHPGTPRASARVPKVPDPATPTDTTH